MKNGKFAKRGVATKTLVMAMAIMLVVGCAIGGTLAWLTDTTEKVENTFTAGKVDITLKETELTSGEFKEGVQNKYKLIPGETYTKNPTVTVVDGSEDCYLFVKFEEKGNASNYITYTSTLNEDNDWTPVDGETNVWYREVKSTDSTKSWTLLAGNVITINADTVTNETMNSADDAELVYTAYAVQKDNVADAAVAWAKIKPPVSGN